MSIIESPSGVGARLAGAREERGLSVEDLSSRTYIRAGVIRGIEDDDFGACGGAFYARGHIRTLARALGVDEGPLLEAFDRQNGTPEPRISAETVTAEPAGRRPRRRSSRPSHAAASSSSGPRWMAAATAVLVVICLVLVVQVLLGGPAKHKQQTPAAPAPANPRTSASAAPGPSTIAAPPPTQPAYTGVNVQFLMANGDSWVRVTDQNGKVLVAQTQPQGSTVSYQGDQSLRFVLGNAGAVQGTCNGQSLGSLGSDGQVASRTLVVGDPACGKSAG